MIASRSCLIISLAFAALLLISAPALSAGPRTFGIDSDRPLPQYRLDTWAVRDGLPSRVITAIAQTPDGFIWLGTPAGLIRFDGVTFDTYDDRNTPSLPGNNVTALLVARDGTLWVGLEWGGCGRFVDGRFIPVVPPEKHWALVKSIVQTDDGSIWIGGWGDTPLRRVTPGGRIYGYRYLGTPDPGPNAMLADGNNVILGLPWTNPRLIHPNGSTQALWSKVNFGVTCRSLARASDGAIWYATALSGAFRMKGSDVKHLTVLDGLPSSVVNTVYVDHRQSVWFGTSNGLCRWDGKSFEKFGKTDGLGSSTVGPIIEDNEANLWVGAGVDLNRFAATKLFPVTMALGSDGAVLMSQAALAPAPDVGAWCCTNKGFWHIDAHSTDHVVLGGKLDEDAVGVASAPDGTEWIWTSPKSGDLQVWHVDMPLHGGKTRFLAGPIQMPKNEIPWVGVAESGHLIGFGTKCVFDIRAGKSTVITPFPGGYEFTAQQDRNGTIWIGDTNGLIRWKDGKATTFTEGLPPDTHVISVDVSDPNCLLLATDHGLGVFRGGRIGLVGASAGLPDVKLFQVLRDNSGRIWMGSHFGIFSVTASDVDAYLADRRRQVPFQGYAASDGIRSFPTIFSSLSTADGRLWFGGDDGVTIVKPDSFEFNPVVPPVSIETASIDGVDLPPGRKIVVDPGVGQLSIRYSALSYVAPEKVRFRYKLDGLDQSWTDAGTRRIASYPYLSPGTYTFRVIACNNDGVWNNRGASVTFVLLPHYYQTAWFRALCVLIGVLLIAAVFRVRFQQIVRQNAELEHKVVKRTAELSEARDTLAEQYDELENRASELEAMQAELEAQNEQLIETQDSLNEANAKLEELATTDGLTGLKNRRALQERMEVDWGRALRYDSPLSLIILDVDKFKSYNDTYGHPAGDEVLRSVGQILADHARETDFVARYGGEEFVVVAGADVEGAVSLAERFRTAIEEAEWPLRPVTASFGVATHARPGARTAAELLSMADSALYRSKQGGRNRVTVYEPGEEQRSAA